MTEFEMGYYDALNEASSVQKYLNHHSIPGDIFGTGLGSTINSAIKSGGSVANLYPKYTAYCVARNIKPLPIDKFKTEGMKFYSDRTESSAFRFFANLLLPAGIGDVASGIYNRTSAFKRNAGMIDDYGA